MTNLNSFFIVIAMNRVVFSEQPKYQGGQKGRKTNEFITFVAKQFKQLTRKNLRVPIQLFHL